MTALTLSVVVDKELPPVVEGAISFETGASPEQVRDVRLHAYEHHGVGFRPDAPGALARFYEDLILGRPFPLKFATRSIADFDTVFAIALFLHRDLAVEPSAPAIFAMVDTAHRLGFPYIAHLDADFGRFLARLRAYFERGLSKREQGERIGTAVGWIHDYITKGVLPHVGGSGLQPRVLDVGTNGFVFAQTNGSLLDAWSHLYRAGFLRGGVVGPDLGEGRRRVLIARKSPYLEFDLTRTATILNEAESAMGEPAEWRQSDSLWLHGPPDGTLLLPSHLVEVLLRV